MDMTNWEQQRYIKLGTTQVQQIKDNTYQELYWGSHRFDKSWQYILGTTSRTTLGITQIWQIGDNTYTYWVYIGPYIWMIDMGGLGMTRVVWGWHGMTCHPPCHPHLKKISWDFMRFDQNIFPFKEQSCLQKLCQKSRWLCPTVDLP